MVSKAKTIPIAEIFGPTLQGEGALAGRPTHFIRVGGCDYSCDWCDSAHAVLAAQVRDLPKLGVAEIIAQVAALSGEPEWVTISGGNPALYDLGPLVAELHDAGFTVAVETQGSKWADWLSGVDLLTVSPKGPSSGLNVQTSLLNLTGFMYQSNLSGASRLPVLKIVVFDMEDYEYARIVHGTYPNMAMYLSTGTAMGGLNGDFVPPAYEDENHSFDKFKQIRESVAATGGMISSKVGIVTQTWTRNGLSDDERSLLNRYRWLADTLKTDAEMSDVVAFPQLHVLLWGHARGV